MERPVSRIAAAVPVDGNGQVQKKQLVLGAEGYELTSPFLRMPEDWFARPGGFGAHPHRGMATVTIVLEGAIEHRDHTGAHGVLRAGDVQWMTAGRGILHSEMPYGEETAHTLQLWVNLPAAMKMIPARYQDQRLADTPVRKLPGAEVRVYAGRSGEVAHPHGSDYPMSLMDLRLAPGATLRQEVPPGDRGFVYVLEGRGRIGGAPVKQGDVAWFEPGEADELSIVSDSAFRGLLVGGAPIREPMVAHGPFVMNTAEEIRQAFLDYQSGRLVEPRR